VATGGLSIPKIGATDLGYRLAKQFGLRVTELAPALDGFTWGDEDSRLYSPLSGLSAEVRIEAGGVSFLEKILFTHAGLSGPAALQASLHWKKGDPLKVDFFPTRDLFAEWMIAKSQGERTLVKNLLSLHLASRLAETLCVVGLSEASLSKPLPQVSERELKAFCDRLHAWNWVPSGTVGYSKAEVTRGGVATEELSSKTLESKKIPGLYFIGEVVDVTGWLGGYNYHWAWASGFAAGQSF
jgi:predicted Rossmann fold flavoprotein